MTAYVCVHGHFYQPPRENPWLGVVEVEDSAHPFHDWNARITAECYGPNANSRILDGEGFVRRIVNNYARMSFNFGPTLLSWLESEAPDVYAAILAADRESRARFGGHGSAIAQAYNHVIMPLTNDRDKRTQVRWGMRDFERRFGRRPEGMWLPETAVDVASLEALAAEGIAYTILAPHQAKGWRPLTGGAWTEGKGIDTGRAYAVRLPSGRSIAAFFYNDVLSHAVAFERLLADGAGFAERLVAAAGQDGGDRLAHIATDGETYGHHHRFGDMALAFALEKIESEAKARLTNYGEFLALHPPEYEAEIAENSSWSCAHGVERWRSDCGCNTGTHPGWNQAWRAPLRLALDWLGGRLAATFERGAAGLLRDPWLARDEYIDVVLDRSPANVDAFLQRHGVAAGDASARLRASRLLEMQHQALLMFASCAWFFEDVGGIETVQGIMHAARAIQLAAEVAGETLESEFVARLKEAKSNLPERGDGAAIYAANVERLQVDLPRVAAHYAVSSLFAEADHAPIGAYQVTPGEVSRHEAGDAQLIVGSVSVASATTGAAGAFSFAAVHLGDQNVTGGVAPAETMPDFGAIVAAFEGGDLAATVHAIDEQFTGVPLSLRSLFRDEQRKVIQGLLEPVVAEAEAVYRGVYEDHISLIRFLAAIDYPLPNRLRAATEFALNLAMRRALSEPAIDGERVESILNDARLANVELDRPGLAVLMQGRLEALAQAFHAAPADAAERKALEGAVTLLATLKLDIDLWLTQDLFYATVQSLAGRDRSLTPQTRREVEGLAAALRVRLP